MTGIEKENASKSHGGSGAVKVDAKARTLLERATPNTESTDSFPTADRINNPADNILIAQTMYFL